MKRNGFLYVGLAVGLGLLAALLLIERPAIADAGPPRPTRPPGEREERIRPREAHRVPAWEAESSAARPLGSSFSEYNVSLFFDDMESGAAKWTWDGLWHLITDTHPSGWGNSLSPVTSWWYGQNSTGNFNTGGTNWGCITITDPINLPASLYQVQLSFWSWEDTECGSGTCGYDVREVDIITSTTAPAWTPLWRTTDDATVEGGWHQVELDLSPYTGNEVLLRFCFDTLDDIANSYRGWYVDDVAVGYDPADLTPEFQAGGGARGTMVDYTLTLRNQTERSDSFDLAVAGNGWPTTLSTGNTGPIAHGDWVTFTVRVDVPASAPVGDVDVADVTATSVLSPTVYSDTATINTTAFSGQYGYVFAPEENVIKVVDTVLHADTGMAIDTSPYGDYPFRGALSPNGQWLYASLRYSDRVLVVDAATRTPVTALPVGAGPHGIAFTADSATAFVANQYGDTVSVIDTGVPTVTATIPVGDEPYSVASSPCLGKVYVTNQNDGTVSVIDVATLAVTQVITGFSGPRDAVISPYGHRAYVSNQYGGTIGVIDTASDSLVDTWVIGGSWLAGLDIAPDGRTLYVADNDHYVTYAVDAVTGQVIATIPTGVDSWDVEVFPASAGPFAYVSAPGDDDVKVVDIDSNTVVGTIPLGGGPRGLALFPPSTVCQHAVLLAPATAIGFGDAGSTVVHTETVANVTGATDSFDLAVAGNGWPTTLSASNTGPIAHGDWVTFTVRVDIPAGANVADSDVVTVTATSALNPSTYSDAASLTTAVPRPGYVFNPGENEIDVVDTAFHADTGMAIDTSPYGDYPFRGALSPNGQWLYASLRYSARVLVVDAATHTPVTTLPVGAGPHGIAFTADSATAFVANQDSDTVSVIDTGVPTVTTTIPVGDEPYSVATSPCLGKVYVTNQGDGTVSVIDVGTLAVTQVITGFDGPRDAVISPYGPRAYVSNQFGGTIGVIDTASDSLVDTWVIGGSWLAGLDIAPDGRTLYVADNDDEVTYAVDTSTGQVAAAIPTGDAWDVETFPLGAGPFAYVSGVGSRQVAVVNVHTNSVVDAIPLSGRPRGLALFPPPATCYVRTHLPVVMRSYP